MLKRLAMAADRAGLRRLVAGALNMSRMAQRFSVDEAGHWVNQQPGGTIVSPDIHTVRMADIQGSVIEHWCHAYAPKSGDIVVEMGSGTGEEALIFSGMVGPTGRIIAVEAHPDTFDCLLGTIERSRLDNVTPVHAAVGDRDGIAAIDDGSRHLANSIMTGGAAEVPMVTLDTLAADVERIDLLRLNIEGAEELAIEGMTSSIGKVRNAVISCHDFCGFPTKAKVVAFLEANGFSVSSRDPDPGRPWIGDYVYAARAEGRTG